MTYDEATTFCQNHCGSTLSVNPEPGKEEDFALILAQYSFIMDSDTDIWTGFHYDSINADWRWPDDTFYGGFTHTQTTGYCGKLVVDTSSLTMTEAPCSQRHRFFCDHCDGVMSKYLILRADIGVTRSWDAAQSYCMSNFNTSLISVHNDNDYYAVKELVSMDASSSAWFGLRGPTPNFDYDQADGTEWDYGTIIEPSSAFPWETDQPDGNPPDECGSFWNSRDYEWDDEGCSASNNFVCFIPSELCNTDRFWQYINGDGGSFQYNNGGSCELQVTSNTLTNQYSHALLTKVQYINNNKVVVQLSFSILNIYNVGSDNDIGILLDVKSVTDYWFVGFQFDEGSGPLLKIYQRINDIKTNIATQSVSSAILTLAFNTYYILIAEFTTTTLSITFNAFSIGDTLSVANTHIFLDLSDGIAAAYSGFIGIAIHNLEVNAKSLYVSGTSMNISPFTVSPTTAPTTPPSNSPSYSPSTPPSNTPTSPPSNAPSLAPSNYPSNIPTSPPSLTPSISPTSSPTSPPTNIPSVSPTSPPSLSPTNVPSQAPSNSPTFSSSPTVSPTNITINPTTTPTINPSNNPSTAPSVSPTIHPSQNPTINPSNNPTINPSNNPTINPSESPSDNPSANPTESPLISPSHSPTMDPTITPITTDYTVSIEMIDCENMEDAVKEQILNALDENVLITETECDEDVVVIKLSITTDPDHVLENDVIAGAIEGEIKDDDRFGDIEVSVEDEENDEGDDEENVASDDVLSQLMSNTIFFIAFLVLAGCLVICCVVTAYFYGKQKVQKKIIKQQSVQLTRVCSLSGNESEVIGTFGMSTDTTIGGREGNKDSGTTDSIVPGAATDITSTPHETTLMNEIDDANESNESNDAVDVKSEEQEQENIQIEVMNMLPMPIPVPMPPVPMARPPNMSSDLVPNAEKENQYDENDHDEYEYYEDEDDEDDGLYTEHQTAGNEAVTAGDQP